jgi:parvulin-like peptidyl-prolyl isomerase
VRKVLVLAVGVLALAGAGCNATSPYAAKVNGATISQGDLNNELVAIRSDPAYLNQIQSQSQVTGAGQDSFDSSFVAQVLNRQIVFQLVHQEAARRGITISDQDVRLARGDVASALGGTTVLSGLPPSYQNSLIRHSAEVTALEASLAHVDVSLAAMAQYYATHQQSFVQQCVSHILLASQADAAAVRAQIAAGASFADAARSQSQDQASARNGGNLGCGPTGRFVTGFEQAVDALPTGQLSQPVQTQFGWHLIEVTSRQPLSFAQAQPQIRAALLANTQSTLTSTLQRAESRASVSVNPRYGTFETRGTQVGIAPPSAPPSSTLNFVPASASSATSSTGSGSLPSGVGSTGP